MAEEIQDLPNPIENRVYAVMAELGVSCSPNCTLERAFLWGATEEGNNIWLEVHRGNYQPWYDYWKTQNQEVERMIYRFAEDFGLLSSKQDINSVNQWIQENT